MLILAFKLLFLILFYGSLQKNYQLDMDNGHYAVKYKNLHQVSGV